MTIEQLIHLLIKEVFANHDVFKQIITDKNKLFTLTFQKKLRKSLKIQKGMFIAFHSQTDDQTKRINQTLKTYFKIFTQKNKHQ